MKKNKYKYYLLLFLFLPFMTGCYEEIQVTDFEESVIQKKTESLSESNTTAVPLCLQYVPASKQHELFDSLLAKNEIIYFYNENSIETLVAFDGNIEKEYIVKARKIGNSDSSILILAGFVADDNAIKVNKVYTSENGSSLPKLGVFLTGKDKYLSQFAEMNKNKDLNIDAITGATPICKPLTKEIQSIIKDTLAQSGNYEIYKTIKTKGKVWHRKVAIQPSSAPEITEQSALKKPETLESTNIQKSDSITFEKASWLEKFLYENSEYIGITELSLILVGICIVIYSQLIRQRQR